MGVSNGPLTAVNSRYGPSGVLTTLGMIRVEMKGQMEQNQISCASVCRGFPTLPAIYPWLVAQNLEANDDTGLQSFHTVHDRLSPYKCRIPELFGRRIRGCFHDWVILSSHPHNIMWSLWNPTTSKFIRLPPLPIYKDGNFDDIVYCCLSSPPGDPTSVLLLLRSTKPNIVFCKVDRKRKRSRWTEMSYAKQLKRVSGNDCILSFPTCCNGKVYALGLETGFIILIDIVVKNKNVLISLSPFQEYPLPAYNGPDFYWMKGSNAELFCIRVCFDWNYRDTIAFVYLFKLDMTSATSSWEEVQDLKDGVFFGDVSHGFRDPSSVFYNPAIPSEELRGHVYIRGRLGNVNVIYSYNVKERTVSLAPMFRLDRRSHVSLWECRLEGGDGPAKCSFKSKQELNKDDETVARSITDDGEDGCSTNILNESPLVNIPFHLLEKIMGYCVGIEYMYFRATCKRCKLAAPVIQRGDKAALGKLVTYSLDSPWLMVLEDKGVMKFTDPIFGDKYFIKTLPVPIHKLDKKIYCSRFGWLLYYSNSLNLVFFNPFTSHVIELPATSQLFDQACFSAPPTSRDCIVVGVAMDDSVLSCYELRFSDENPLWHGSSQDDWGNPDAFYFPTFYGSELYALHNEGVLIFFQKDPIFFQDDGFYWRDVAAKAPKYDLKFMTRYYLVTVAQNLLLVAVGGHGEFVEVFHLNVTSPKEWVWEKINSIGQHTIYICDTTCLSIESKTPKMKNKIFFARLHSHNGKIVFYSLETRMFHTFNGQHIDEEATSWGFFETQHLLYPHVWIEPSWK